MDYVKTYAVNAEDALFDFYLEEFNGRTDALNTSKGAVERKLQAWQDRGNVVPGNNTNAELATTFKMLVKNFNERW